jgi:tetratricopeptide (TPR) repeat protein
MRDLAAVMILALLFSASPRAAERALPESVVRSFGEAEELYRNGDHDGALETYKEIEGRGHHSWALDYNMGNAAFRSRRFGEAVFYYERALRANPRDPDLQHNYAMVRSALGLESRAEEPFRIGWLRRLGGLTAAYSLADAVRAAVALYWLGAMLGILMLSLGRWRTALRHLLRGLIILAIPVALALGFKAWEVEHGPNGVLIQSTGVFSAPQSDVQQLTQLSEGTLVRQRRRLGDWYEVEVGEGVRGWVPQEKLRRL